MYKKFVMGIAAMAALTLVSCSSDDLDSFSDNSSKNEAISFDGYLGRSAVAVNGTRGGVLDKPALQKLTDGAFGVFGNYSKDVTTTYGENLFKNQKVTYDNAKSKWTYTPYKYWLPEGHIDFLAYAPYDAKYTPNDAGTVLKNTSCIDFTVSSTIADQKDLLWANAKNQTQDNDPVKFTFNHALSRLGYTVKLKEKCADDVTITLKSIKLAGTDDGTKGAFYEKGTIDLVKANKEDNLWSGQAGQQKFDWFSGDYNVKSSTASHPTNPDSKSDYLFVIPQDFSATATDKLYVIVTYSIQYNNGISEVFTNTVHKQIIQKFEQGKAYTINLTIGRPIDFDVNVVTGWEPADGTPIDIDSWE